MNLGLTLMLVPALAGASEFDRMTARDKEQHAVAGFAIGMISAELVSSIDPKASRLERFALALAPVVLAGVGKELLDSRDRSHHSPECRDAIATVIGGCVGISIRFTF